MNAVYFNAAWAAKFEPSKTAQAPFTKADGSVVQASMMNREASRRYAKGDGYEAVEMAYDNGRPYASAYEDVEMALDNSELAMLVILPTAGTFATFESSLTGGKLLDILAGLETKKVNLYFPRLKLDVAFGLKEPLKSLGMNQAFSEEAADFSGMSTTGRLSVANVLHKTFLEVDESGSEAAAATGVINVAHSASTPVEMKVDRPFITAIVDRPTKTLLFLGRIHEPKL